MIAPGNRSSGRNRSPRFTHGQGPLDLPRFQPTLRGHGCKSRRVSRDALPVGVAYLGVTGTGGAGKVRAVNLSGVYANRTGRQRDYRARSAVFQSDLSGRDAGRLNCSFS